MKRLITDKLIEWKNSSSRKPLLIKGAKTGRKNLCFVGIREKLLR